MLARVRSRFKTRLTVLAAAAVAIAIALASCVIFFVVRSTLRAQVDATLLDTARNVVEQDPVDGGINISLPRNPLDRSRGYAELLDEKGVSRPSDIIPNGERAIRVAAGKEPAFFDDVRIGDTHARVLTRRVLPGVAVQVTRSLEEIDASLRELAFFLAVIALIGIGIAAALGEFVARTALVPVKRLTETAEHVTNTSDLSLRIEVAERDELGRLASSFNSMLEALERSLHTQRQLVADASHELRTPLTSVRTNIEVLQRSDSLEPEDRRRLIEDVTRQLSELTALVGDLVELAREGEQAREFEDFRLDELVTAAVVKARRNFPSIRFNVEAEASIVRGVPERVDRAVMNLLDNAAKFGPDDSVVEVDVRNGAVRVRDHGIGIDEADLPFVFERFYRSSAARRTTGSGLGLAIVKKVAELHGGRAAVENAEGGGARFLLRLPSDGHP